MRRNTMQLNDYEAHCLQNGTNFTAVRGNGASRTRQDFDTLEAVQEYAKQFNDKRTMVYAVTQFGNSAHICNL